MNQNPPSDGKVIDLASHSIPIEEIPQGGPQNRVVVIIPSGEQVHAEFMMRLVTMSCMYGVTPDYMILGYVNQKSSLVHACREGAISNAIKSYKEYNPTHYLWLDSDMGFPPQALHKLLSQDKDIIGCDYPMRRHPFHPTASLTPDHKKIPFEAQGTIEVAGLGFGFTLIKARVFDELKSPHFAAPWGWNEGVDEPVVMGEDYYFCNNARQAGFRIWCDYDLSKEIIHYGQASYTLAFAERYAKRTQTS